MKLVNKETGEEVEYIEGDTFFNPDIWELVEGEINEEDLFNFLDEEDE